MTPLHLAAEKNSKEYLALLLSHGADVNIKDNVSNDHTMNWWVDNDHTMNWSEYAYVMNICSLGSNLVYRYFLYCSFYLILSCFLYFQLK